MLIKFQLARIRTNFPRACELSITTLSTLYFEKSPLGARASLFHTTKFTHSFTHTHTSHTEFSARITDTHVTHIIFCSALAAFHPASSSSFSSTHDSDTDSPVLLSRRVDDVNGFLKSFSIESPA